MEIKLCDEGGASDRCNDNTSTCQRSGKMTREGQSKWRWTSWKQHRRTYHSIIRIIKWSWAWEIETDAYPLISSGSTLATTDVAWGTKLASCPERHLISLHPCFGGHSPNATWLRRWFCTTPKFTF